MLFPAKMTCALMIGRLGISLIVLGCIALAGCIWLLVVKILRHRYDQILELETKREISLGEGSGYESLVTVIPQAQLPKEKPTVFMPVPSDVDEVISFVTMAVDHVDVRSCITVSDAERVMTDERAETLLATLYQERPAREVRATVYLDDLSNYFSPCSFINLHILKQRRLVNQSTTHLTIEARGVVRKPLMIVANNFTPAAIKMISLTGGRAVQLKELIQQ